MTTLGFIGLGNMGGDMAKRLIDAGHDVLVWNRSPERAEALIDLGARVASSPSEALSAEVSFSMLANDAAVEDVLTNEAIRACGANSHVVMASISPTLSDRLSHSFEASGAKYVAAPVLGRPEVAAAGQLQILAAGDPKAVSDVTPYLEVLGKRVWQLGTKPSIANAVKIAVNYNIIHALQALGESIAMAERVGVNPSIFVDLLSSTLFGGVVYSGYGSLIAEQRYSPPGFTVALGRKDLALAEELARSTNLDLATLPALIGVFEEALARPELREGDWSAIAEVTRRQ
ncbi:3-hydroxyisobutyrate dehydrogenase-like beta-hydroxyacid dehydrogenase [Arthrobacter sp. AG367]|uniref:NAD(P)-dependent oxidoreductase n=1 Tax=Arthrobacter sp. AG367 TaxID=2572909 RepID=UPI0011A7731C|nr:NAD(P)-dependent oxidoreductase [Arthrobacter sp. AG367]TWD47090.1 3-hydroxyisobutyrate dehydrogenase-like beta-hydroxyacid dehydrogenase [Arthrobacter sp. AG367]